MEHNSSLNYPQKKSMVPWNVVDVLLILIVWRLMLTDTVIGPLESMLQLLGASSTIANYMAFIVIHVIQMVVVWLIIIRRYRLTWKKFGFHSPTRQNWIQLIPWIIFANLLSFLVLWLTFSLIWKEESSKVQMAESIGFFLTILMASVAAPIIEETVNRGVIYAFFRSRFGVAAGVVISGLIFGIGHAPELMLNATVVGFLLAIFYERSSTLWMPIILHAIMNGILIFIFFLY